ncbi:MAG: TolC family protein [Bryobacteraceae bacterium]|nr:TolC family protein [Bryobacteraceae bacterium]
MKRYLLSLVVVTASAQTTLTLKDALAAAVAAHPLIQASEGRMAVSEGFRRQADLKPNPVFNFQAENIRFSGNPPFQYWTQTDTFALLSQTFETGGKRSRRVELAETGVRRAELERELLRKQIADRVKRAYWAAAGRQRIHELLIESASNFLRTVEFHEIRVTEGAMAEADLLRVRLESERLKLAANGALLEADRARIALFREMGQTGVPDAVRYDSLEIGDAPTPAADLATALGQRTEMKLARAAIAQAEANVLLQRAVASPDVAGILGYKRNAGLDTLVAGFQVGLPVRNRNEGNILAASAEVTALRSELASAAAVVQAEVAAARRDYEVRLRQIGESLRPMLDQAAESAAIAQAAYREGGWDLLRLLDAERLRIETESLYFQALAEYRQSIAALETAMGVAP